ncbi:MAG: glycosyltransferase family 2 protein [Tabrizicola sp.]|jgi:hypothetical protein|nr:glycosyltransferase family 2 protein [Tabrizicola sp.]
MSKPVQLAEPQLTVIIVSYNTRDLTLAALRTLFSTTLVTQFKVVVFDNASNDGSADAVAQDFPQVELVRSVENLGFARANNMVAACATTEFLLLLNPDTECHPGAVDNLVEFAQAQPQAGIWGGRTVFSDGSLNLASCWQRITLWSAFCMSVGLTAAFPRSSIFNTEAMGGWGRDTVRRVDIVSGCFFLVRREIWARLGGFDLRYFMYGEEADLCLRAHRMGFQPMVTPEAEIVHLEGASSSNLARKRQMVAKARMTLIRDHWPAWQVPFGVGLMWLWGAVRFAASRPFAWASSEEKRARAAYWADVWRHRRDWLAGY